MSVASLEAFSNQTRAPPIVPNLEPRTVNKKHGARKSNPRMHCTDPPRLKPPPPPPPPPPPSSPHHRRHPPPPSPPPHPQHHCRPSPPSSCGECEAPRASSCWASRPRAPLPRPSRQTRAWPGSSSRWREPWQRGGAGEAAREVPAQLFVDLLLLGAQDADAVADGAACGSWGGLGRGCGRGGMVKMKVGMDGVGGYVPGKALATSSNSAVETWRPMVTSISLFSLAPSHVNFCGWG